MMDPIIKYVIMICHPPPYKLRPRNKEMIYCFTVGIQSRVRIFLWFFTLYFLYPIRLYGNYPAHPCK